MIQSITFKNSNFPRNLKNYLFFFLGIKNKKGFFYKILNYENYSETYQIARRIKKNLKNNQIFALSKIKKIKEKKLIKTKYITISIGGFHNLNYGNLNTGQSYVVNSYLYIIIK